MNLDRIIKSKRIEAIDWMKGLCIISIVLLHVEDGIFPMWLNNVIGMFMITGFYVTSGWVHGLKYEDTVDIRVFAKKRLKSLGVPYFWFTLILLLVDAIFVLLGHYDLNILLRDGYKSIVLRGIGTLWFLPVLFFGELAFIFFKSKGLNMVGLIMGLAVDLIISFVIVQVEHGISDTMSSIIKAPLLVVKNSATALFVITSTYYVSKSCVNKTMGKMNLPTGLLIFIISFICIYFNVSSLFSGSLFISSFVSLILSWLEPLGILILLSHIKRNNIMLRYLNYWGRNSIILMTIHYSILMELCIFVCNKALGLPMYGITSWVYFMLIMALQYPLTELINKKCKFLIGR